MALVLGDHQEIDQDTTRQIVLVDMVQNGGKLRVIQPNGANDYLSIDILPSDGPIRYQLDIPKICNYISLELPGNEIIHAKIDHRNGLSVVLIYSCDHVEADIENSLWESLSREYDNSVNIGDPDLGRILHLHIGDNIYADHAWNESQNNPETATEKYRRRYRKTWFGNDNRKNTYKSGSHLMIEDDHFVVNDYTFSENEQNEISQAAYQCYNDYQIALHLPELQQSIGGGWIRRFGDDVIVTFERFMEPVNIENVINSLQTIKNQYNPLGLIIATGWPCIPSPRDTFCGELYRRAFGVAKFLSDDVLSRFYEALFELNVNHIVLVGGDLHFGFIGRIVHSDHRYIDLVIASPISNHPDVTRKIASSGYPDAINMGNNIHVIPFLVEGNRNYLRIKISQQSLTRYHPTLVMANQWLPSSFRRFLNSLNRMR